MFLQFLTHTFVLMMTIPIFAQTPPIETGVSQTLAKWRSANYSDVRYKLNITLEKGAPLMKGEIEVRVNLTDEGAKNDLILDWRTTQFANDKDKPFADVVAVNDMRTDVSNETFIFLRDEHLIISKPLLKTGENIIKINFASPIKTSGAAVTRYVDKEDGAEYVYSLFVPSDASTAFPVFDQPDLKARFSLSATIPTDWKFITNTVVETEERIEKGHCGENCIQTKFYFLQTQPISTYVFAFAAGNFESFNECSYLKQETNNKLLDCLQNKNQQIRNTSKIYVRKSQAEKFKAHAKEVFRLNREGVKFLESWFDYKFPFPKYDLVLTPEFPFGGMEHAGATFLREDRIIFPTEPTKNDYITRANVIFHEAAHQWFGDTVTMKWFDDLWLKEGFAEFMAYKTLEKVMPEYNAWKIFYERNKQAAYLTDVTRGTTPIYQEIPNLSSAKSAYGNIVYRKAPSFLRQAEFYLGEDKFQTAVRAFLKKHEFANAEWTDLVKEFLNVELKDKSKDIAANPKLKETLEDSFNRWANTWVKNKGVAKVRVIDTFTDSGIFILQEDSLGRNLDDDLWKLKLNILFKYKDGKTATSQQTLYYDGEGFSFEELGIKERPDLIFPNYQDYGYGIFLLDKKSRAYVLENIGAEKDDFLRSMMWGSLWDSVRFYEIAPEDYVKLVIKNINTETDESTIQTLLGRVSTAMNYYIKSEPSAVTGGLTSPIETSAKNINAAKDNLKPSATADGSDKAELAAALEKLLIDKIQNSPTAGERITYYRAFLNIASTENARIVLKQIYNEDLGIGGGNTKMRPGLVEDKAGNKTYAASPVIQLKQKDRFDIVTRLLILGDKDAPDMLADLEKNETNDSAKRYAYAAKAGIPTAENKAKYWNDFVNNKDISESWIEAAFGVWNSSKHAELTLPYLEKALAELPNLKRNRKIFFVNGWLSAFIGGQKSEEALKIVNKFLENNPNLDRDLRLKILENADGLERAVKIRAKFAK